LGGASEAMNVYIYYYLTIALYVILGIVFILLVYWIIRACKSIVSYDKTMKNMLEYFERKEKKEDERSMRRIH
jgi:hypothetical protein